MKTCRSAAWRRTGWVCLLGGLAWVLGPGEAWAQNLPDGLAGIAQKVRDIQGLVTNVATVIVAIGAVLTGVKFVKGDPSAWDYAWKFGLGAVLVASAAGLVQWLGG